VAGATHRGLAAFTSLPLHAALAAPSAVLVTEDEVVAEGNRLVQLCSTLLAAGGDGAALVGDAAGITPLHLACGWPYGHAPNTHVDRRSRLAELQYGGRPEVAAARDSLVRLLLRHARPRASTDTGTGAAPVDVRDAAGRTPFHYACAAGATDVIALLLLPAGADATARAGRAGTHGAPRGGPSGMHLWARGSSSLHGEVPAGEPVAVRRSGDPAPTHAFGASDGDSSTSCAALHPSPTRVRQQLAAADACARLLVFDLGLSPHEHEQEHNKEAPLEHSVDVAATGRAGAAPSGAGSTPLHLAAAAGAYHRVAALTDVLVGCDPLARDAGGTTPLEVATQAAQAAGNNSSALEAHAWTATVRLLQAATDRAAAALASPRVPAGRWMGRT
jgi:hypothetical protein